MRFQQWCSSTRCGQCYTALCDRVSQSCFGEMVLNWYTGIYSGSIILFLSVFNIITVPYLNYLDEMLEETDDWYGLKLMLSIQILFSCIYAFDLILMVIVFGVKDVFLKRSYALRLELVFIIFQLWEMPVFKDIFNERSAPSERAMVVDFIECFILIRLLRIFSFLQELQ